jgi:hypothetical protein
MGARPPQACTPPPRRRARPLRRARPPPRRRARPTPAYVRAPLHRRRVRPIPLACAPYPAGVCAPHQLCAPPSSQACVPPLIAGVRALTCRRARPPPRWCARPTPLACTPPADVRAMPVVVRALPSQCTRPHRWWQNKIYKEGSLTSPLHHAWLCILGLLCGLLA